MTILLTHAEYGQYSQSCDAGTCCTPHPFDCAQSMEENNFDEWLLLKLACDNRTECSYLFQGSTFTDDVCAPLDSVAYLEIYHTCLPGRAVTKSKILHHCIHGLARCYSSVFDAIRSYAVDHHVQPINLINF